MQTLYEQFHQLLELTPMNFFPGAARHHKLGCPHLGYPRPERCR